MNTEKTGKPDRWSKGFKKKLLCELEELGGDFDRVAWLNGVEVSQLQRWQKRYEGEARFCQKDCVTSMGLVNFSL